MNNIESHSTYKKFQAVPSSTPNTAVSSRKSIHPDRSVSPIRKPSSKYQRNNGTRDERLQDVHLDGSDTDEEDEYTPTEPPQQPAPAGGRFGRRTSILIIIHSLGMIVVCSSMFFSGIQTLFDEFTTTNSITVNEIQATFPLQSTDLWTALETGVGEVKKFNRPSVFFLVFENKAESTVDRLLTNISKYASCVLNEDCSIAPIELTTIDLNAEKAVRDYGYIIDRYRGELKERSVMIVKHLEQVPGQVAQVFHSMCDEITPLVAKTAFFFTMQIEGNEIKKRDMQIVEDVLRNRWSDLEDDIFYPLFTRMSSMVLRIVPE